MREMFENKVSRNLNLVISALFLLTGSIGLLGQEEDKSNSHKIIAGVNLATPFGSMKSRYGEYNFYTVSYISANTCGSVYIEYQYSKLRLRMPIRFPLTQFVDESSGTNNSYGYYGGTRFFTNYEIGILPGFTFNTGYNKLKAFVYAGPYIGSHYGILTTYIDTYTPNTTNGEYTIYDTHSITYTKSESNYYSRITMGAGLEVFFTEKLGMSTDLAFYRGKGYPYFEESITNYGTTDGVYYRDHEYHYLGARWGVQYGLNLIYRIL